MVGDGKSSVANRQNPQRSTGRARPTADVRLLSNLPSFHCSNTPSFHYSTIPSFHHSLRAAPSPGLGVQVCETKPVGTRRAAPNKANSPGLATQGPTACRAKQSQSSGGQAARGPTGHACETKPIGTGQAAPNKANLRTQPIEAWEAGVPNRADFKWVEFTLTAARKKAYGRARGLAPSGKQSQFAGSTGREPRARRAKQSQSRRPALVLPVAERRIVPIFHHSSIPPDRRRGCRAAGRGLTRSSVGGVFGLDAAPVGNRLDNLGVG